MFHCPLHNWSSSESPCPACYKVVTVSDLTYKSASDLPRQNKEAEYWKKEFYAASDRLHKWIDETAERRYTQKDMDEAIINALKEKHHRGR